LRHSVVPVGYCVVVAYHLFTVQSCNLINVVHVFTSRLSILSVWW